MCLHQKVVIVRRGIATMARSCAVVPLLLLALTQAAAHDDARHANSAHADGIRHGRHDTHRIAAHTSHPTDGDHVTRTVHATRYRRSIHHYSVPDVTLVDMDGAYVHLPDALGGNSPTMVNFIFTSCTTICPVLSMTFSQSQELLAAELGDLTMISISIDPEHDTPDRLRAYAKRHDAGDRWRFLTGSRSDILAVQKAFDAYRGSKMSHEPFTLLHASADAPWVRLEGFAGAADLVAEYRRAVSP